jgi:hypothetical protein
MTLDLNSKHQIENSCYGEHNIMIYDDLYTLREVYCRSAKNALEKNNEIMFIVTTYETPNTVRQMLGEYEVDVKKYESDGSLLIIDSVQACQVVTFYGVLRLIQLLANRAQKDGRYGCCCCLICINIDNIDLSSCVMDSINFIISKFLKLQYVIMEKSVIWCNAAVKNGTEFRLVREIGILLDIQSLV